MANMKTSYKIALAIAALGILWMASGIFSSSPADKAPEDVAPALKKVAIETSEARNYQKFLILRGRTEASRDVILRAEVDGPIKSVLAERGAEVSESEPIAEISPQDRPAKLEEARARVAELEAKLSAAQKLYEKGYRGITALEEAKANLEQAKAALKQIQIQLGNTLVKAPFDGVLADRHVEVGDYVKAGDEMAEVVDLDPLYVVAEVSEIDVGKLYTGIEGSSKTVTGIERQGYLHYIAPNANPVTRTYRIEMTVENPGYKIPSGLTAEISIPLKSIRAHKISPASLSLSDDGSVGVKFVDSNSIVRFQSVSILADEQDGVWIDSLPDQVNLITVGQDYVKEGEKVDPVLSDGSQKAVSDAQPD